MSDQTLPFTPLLQQAISLGYNAARQRKWSHVGIIHVLFALLEINKGMAILLLQRSNLLSEFCKFVATNLPQRAFSVKCCDPLPMSESLTTVLFLAEKESRVIDWKNDFIGTEHLLLALADKSLLTPSFMNRDLRSILLSILSDLSVLGCPHPETDWKALYEQERITRLRFEKPLDRLIETAQSTQEVSTS